MDRIPTILESSMLLVDACVPDDPSALTSSTIPEEAQLTKDLRERATQLQQQGLSRLARWCSSELRQRPLDGAHVSETLREALRRLASDEDRFEYVPDLLTPSATMTAFAETRAGRWPDAFRDALTHGAQSRPIDMHAHDAVRYVSDMLAWIHQALATERDMLTSLFPTTEAAQRRIGAPHMDDMEASVGASLAKWHRRILERSLAGCASPLQQRVQQTLSTERTPLILLRLYLVLRFYRVTMEHTVGVASPLCGALDEYVCCLLTQAFVTGRCRSRTCIAASLLASPIGPNAYSCARRVPHRPRYATNTARGMWTC
ncbi:Golgi transport complex subunit 6 [Malassezia pachydermatis]